MIREAAKNTLRGGCSKIRGGESILIKKQIALYCHPKNEILNKFLSKGSCQKHTLKNLKNKFNNLPKNYMSTQDENH